MGHNIERWCNLIYLEPNIISFRFSNVSFAMNHFRNPDYMNIYCAKSCDRCSGDCEDESQDCPTWAGKVIRHIRY